MGGRGSVEGVRRVVKVEWRGKTRIDGLLFHMKTHGCIPALIHSHKQCMSHTACVLVVLCVFAQPL